MFFSVVGNYRNTEFESPRFPKSEGNLFHLHLLDSIFPQYTGSECVENKFIDSMKSVSGERDVWLRNKFHIPKYQSLTH